MRANTAPPILAKIMPFIGVGIFLVIMVIAFILLSYVLLIGAVIGLVLFCVAYVRQKFFPSKKKSVSVFEKKHTRIYDNDEFK